MMGSRFGCEDSFNFVYQNISMSSVQWAGHEDVFSCLPVQHAVTVRRVCEFELVHSRLQSVVAGYQSNMVSFCSLLGYRFVVACRYLWSMVMKIGVAAGDVPGSLPLPSAEAFDVLSNDAKVIAGVWGQ